MTLEWKSTHPDLRGAFISSDYRFLIEVADWAGTSWALYDYGTARWDQDVEPTKIGLYDTKDKAKQRAEELVSS